MARKGEISERLGKPSGKSKVNTSGFNGVFFHKRRKDTPFYTCVTINGKHIQSGHRTIREAAIAADKIYIEHKLYHLLNILKPVAK